jgi:hypothetical protein
MGDVRYSCKRTAAAIPKPQRGGIKSAQGNALGWTWKWIKALKGRNKMPGQSGGRLRGDRAGGCAALSGLSDSLDA